MARKRSNETYSKIVSVAESLFLEFGYMNTTMKEISVKSGVALGTLYSYFKNKKDLLNNINNQGNVRIRPEFERKRKQIISSALMLFGEKGYEGVTMDEIAASVGFTKAALYLYCEGKEDLFSQVLQESTLNIVTMEIKQAGSRNDWESAIQEIGRSYLTLARTPERTALLRSVIRDSGKFPEIGRLYFERGFFIACKNMAEYLEDVKKAGLIRDIDLYTASASYLGTLQSFIITHYVMRGVPETVSDEEYFKISTEIFCNGLKPNGASQF